MSKTEDLYLQAGFTSPEAIAAARTPTEFDADIVLMRTRSRAPRAVAFLLLLSAWSYAALAYWLL